MYRVL